MKVGVYSHCTIDTIMYGNTTYEVAGGPACYCSLTLRNQNFDVNLSTKYGKDFPLTDFFEKNKINMPEHSSTTDTTRFKIILNDSDRELLIQNRCEPLEFIDEKNGVASDYESRPVYQQNDYIGWIERAKRQETKEKRFQEMVDELKAGGVNMKMKHPASRKNKG